MKAVCAMIVINDDFFASADGLTLAFWTKKDVIWTIDLPVIAMAYLPKLDQIVACVKNSRQLHFIYLRYPYTVRVHPLHFTDRDVQSMHFYESTSTLVCAGHGVLFTRVVVPPYFKNTQPVPETLQFERIGEYYRSEHFEAGGIPFISRSSGVVIACVGNKIFVHMPNGVLVQKLTGLDIDGSITSVSYHQPGNSLVIGDDTGCLNVLKFVTPNPFVPGAAPDSGKIVKKLKISDDRIIVGEIIDRNFLIGVDNGHQMYIYSLKDDTKITSYACPIRAVTGQMMSKYLILFSTTSMVGYDCSIFTRHWTDMEYNAIQLQRCKSASKPARIIAFLTNRSVNAYSPKLATQIWGFMSTTSARDIQTFGLTRDALIDGKKYELIQADDIGFASLDQGYFAIMNFDHIQQTSETFSNVFMSTFRGFEIGWVPTESIKLQILDRFVSVIRIESKEYPNCICCILQNGNCIVISMQTKKVISQFSCGVTGVICATYSFSNRLLVVSALDKLQTFNITTKSVVQSIEGCYFTSLLLIDKDTLVCGAANGAVEVRSLRTFRLLGNSKTFNTFHTDHGHRYPLESYYQDTRVLYDVPFAVKALDYCECRDALLSLSVGGEIFVWNRSAFPLAHIACPFKLFSACFLNGEGTILVSAFRGLFSIDWSLMFEKQFLPVSTVFDDFDLREGNEDNAKSKPAVIRRQESSLSLTHEVEHEDKPDNTFLSEFTDLVVDVEVLPKRFFAPIRPGEIEEEPKVIKRAPDMDELLKKSQPKQKKDADFEFILQRKRSPKVSRGGTARASKQKKKKEPKEPTEKPKKTSSRRSSKKFAQTTPVKVKPIPAVDDVKVDFSKHESSAAVSEQNEEVDKKLAKALLSQSSPAWKHAIRDDLMKETGFSLESQQPMSARARMTTSFETSDTHELDNPPIEDAGFPVREPEPEPEPVPEQEQEPEPVVTRDSFFQTESQVVTMTVREPQTQQKSARRKRPRGLAVKFRPEDRVITVDDAMFTNYRIDGFKSPFGGFVFNRGDQAVLARSANAPVVRIRTIPRNSTQAKPAPKPVLVRPPSYPVYYSHMNNTC